MIELVLLNKQM